MWIERGWMCREVLVPTITSRIMKDGALDMQDVLRQECLLDE